jgi:tetratricopeptide (TPR) repeat protein
VSGKQLAACPDEEFRRGLLGLADKTIKLTDGAARAYAARGWLLADFGAEEKALADLRTAFAKLPDVEESGKPGLSSTSHELSHLCGELAHHEDAVSCLAMIAELQPGNVVYSNWAALALLGAGRSDEYSATCRDMASRFQATKKVNQSYWVAWTCLLGPEAVDDYEPVIRLAEQTVAAEPEWEMYIKTLGGIFYRAGRWEEAIERLTEADNLVQEPDSKSNTSPAYTWYFLAMANHKQGQHANAEKWLAKANEWTDKVLRQHEDGTASLPWNRRLTLKLFREEAEGMIGTPDEPGDDTER